MDDERRRKYQNRQIQMVRALFDDQSAPEGINANRLNTLRESLLRKRARVIARNWPALREELGKDWFHEFTYHMAIAGGMFTDNAHLDGLRFAQWLTGHRQLGISATMELLRAELAQKKTRSWVLALGSRIAGDGTILLGISAPWLGIRTFALRPAASVRHRGIISS